MKPLQWGLVALAALCVCVVGATYVWVNLNRDNCVGLPQSRLVAIARQKALLRYRDALSAFGGGPPSRLEKAKVVQFIDWKDPKAGYTIYLAVPGDDNKFLGIDMSGACSIHFSYAEELLPPI